MCDLIHSLAAAHRATLDAIAAGGDRKPLSAVARKLESTLVSCLADTDQAALCGLVLPIANSGSLKALKALPEAARIQHDPYFSHRIDPDFVFSQPLAFLTEVQRRGFTLSPDGCIKVFEGLSRIVGQHCRLTREALLLKSSISRWTMSRIIEIMLEMEPEAAARMARLAARLLKSGVKENSASIAQDIDALFCIHDPAAAHEHLYPTIADYALLHVRAPSRDAIEHDEMKRLATALFSRDGRKALKEETGGIEAWLAGGHRKSVAILRDLERKRASFRVPAAFL